LTDLPFGMMEVCRLLRKWKKLLLKFE